MIDEILNAIGAEQDKGFDVHGVVFSVPGWKHFVREQPDMPTYPGRGLTFAGLHVELDPDATEPWRLKTTKRIREECPLCAGTGSVER